MTGIVASLAEAWIEIPEDGSSIKNIVVASLAEAWIEIRAPTYHHAYVTSALPLRKRGLKFRFVLSAMRCAVLVASLAEAWIEIL